MDGRKVGGNYRLEIDVRRRITIVITPGGRVGFIKTRDPKSKRITVAYFDGEAPDNEVTVAENLPGLRLIVLTARQVFRREAGEGKFRTRAARAAATARKTGRRGAGVRATALAP